MNFNTNNCFPSLLQRSWAEPTTLPAVQQQKSTSGIKQDLFAGIDPSQPGAASIATFGYKCHLAIENKDVSAIVDLVNNTADSFLVSLGKAPTDFLTDSLHSNLKSLEKSNLPDDLKQLAEKQLKNMFNDYALHMQYDIGNATQGINNYKSVLAPITNDNIDKEKVLVQAPHIFAALDKLLHELSDHLHEIVGVAVNVFYTITMDTITNQYENWQKMPNNQTIWMDPEFTHNQFYLQNSQYGYMYRTPPGFVVSAPPRVFLPPIAMPAIRPAPASLPLPVLAPLPAFAAATPLPLYTGQ